MAKGKTAFKGEGTANAKGFSWELHMFQKTGRRPVFLEQGAQRRNEP